MRQPEGRRWAVAVLALVVAAGAAAPRPTAWPTARPTARLGRADLTGQPPEPPKPPTSVPAVLRQGTLSFDGHATTGDFVGRTTSVTGAATVGPDLATARGWVEAPVATLRTGNGLRDRDLRKSMQVETYPAMRYELSGATVQAVSGDSATLLLHGTLRLHGVSRSVDVPVTVTRSGSAADGARSHADTSHGETAHVVGTFPVNVTDYQVGGLTKALGMLRMHERIEVHLDLVFVTAS